MTLTHTEENYLKCLYKLTADKDETETGTNDIAEQLDVKPATVSDMLKKLRGKKLVSYEKYGKIKLTAAGKSIALQIVRKHRLWETFLVEKLQFSWDEVHEIAEELEHIQSVKLINRLDAFLHFPKKDPHGDPIPDAKGNCAPQDTTESLWMSAAGKNYSLSGVRENTAAFLKYIKSLGFEFGSVFALLETESYDESSLIVLNGKEVRISRKVAENLLVQQA